MSMMSATPPEETEASWLVRQSLLSRFEEKGHACLDDYSRKEPESPAPPQEDEPIRWIKANLPLPGGHHIVTFEEFRDGSWAVFFEDFPSIIGGSNDSWEDALDVLAEIVCDDIQDIKELKKSKDNDSSPYQKRRYKFLKEVFKV